MDCYQQPLYLNRLFTPLSPRERMDHQVVEMAQSLEHMRANPKAVGLSPTLADKIFHYFPSVCGEQFFISIFQ